MNTAASAKQTPRTYSSALRDRQSEQTRELILQALTEQLSEAGLQDFNIPAVARRAGVSVRTVYRYFPTKDALLEAVEQWLDKRVLGFKSHETLEDILSAPEGQFAVFDENPQMVLAQFATPTGRAVRARGRRLRRDATRAALEEVTSNLPHSEARDALAIVAYLFSSATWRAFREEFDMNGRESGRAVSWALRTLVADLRLRNNKAARR